MTYIFPVETATGTVDGVNKTFTLTRNIYQIDYVIVDGVIYGGNVVFVQGTPTFLLEDAPVFSLPQVAYYDSAVSLPTGQGITVAELRTEFLKRMKDTSDIDAISGTFMQWCNYINRHAYRELTNVQPEQYIRTQTYTWTSGTSTYALPSDFDNVSPQGTGMYEIDNNGQDTDRRLALTNFGSTSSGWYMNKQAFTVTPIPSESKNYRLRYIPMLTDLTLETEQMVIPRAYSWHIMNVLNAYYDVWDTDNGDEAWNDERVNNSLQELLSQIKPDGQNVVIDDFTSAYYY